MKKLITLILSILYLININSSYLYGGSNSIEVLRNNTRGSTLKMRGVVSKLYYGSNNINKTEFSRTSNIGHAFVVNNNNGTIYDSGNGAGGTIIQKYSDCALHSTNNFFMVTQIGEMRGFNGKLYYSNFAYIMNNNLNMYMVFYFLEQYARLREANKFDSFDAIISTNNEFILGADYNSVKDMNINRTIVQKILAEANINPTGENDKYTQSDYIRMLRYVFSYIKNGDLSSSSFSIAEDMPQFLWLFEGADKETLGITDKGSGKLTKDDISDLIDEYVGSYEKTDNQRKVNQLMSYYTIIDLNRIEDMEKIINSKNNGFSFNLDYNSNNGSRLAMLYHSSSKFIFDVLVSYRNFSLDNEGTASYSYITAGISLGINYNLFAAAPSSFRVMFITDFDLDKNNDFNYRDINLMIANTNSLDIDGLILSKIELTSSFSYTKRYLTDGKVNNSSKYVIADTEHNSYLLNLNLNLVKIFRINNYISNNISLGLKYVLNLSDNNNNNMFRLNNKSNNTYSMVKSTNQYKDLYAIDFNYNITVNKKFNLNLNLTKELNYRNNIAFGVGIRMEM